MDTLRILVVDGNVDTSAMYGECLRADGHEVRQSYGALEALADFRKFNPHLILVDIGLPDMSGRTFAQHVRVLPGGLKVYIVAASEFGQHDLALSAAAGIDLHLFKPLSAKQLSMLLLDFPRRKP